VALDAGDTQAVRRVEVKIQKRLVRVRMIAPPEAYLDFRDLRRKARLFEKEFAMSVRFDRARWQLSSAERSSRDAGQPSMKQRAAALPRRSAA
jgi:hypothetical protein